ncbi:MAG: MBL fold metallo-hydrolase [Planctomycetes bacterium]|nr:MBL fold metallo-hydrolase [Planctomycetota bacterium]
MPRLSRRTLLATILALVLPLLAPPYHLTVADDAPPAVQRPLTVTFLDIGQGDSTLIETPDGRTILIDGGEGHTPDAAELYPFDAGLRVVLPVLKKKGITTLDLVIATHPHSDHIGGLADVLAEASLTIREFWHSGHTAWVFPSYERVQKILMERKIPSIVPELGKTCEWGKGVSATVLHLDPSAKNPNASSIVVKMAYGETSFLFTGDAEEAAEAAMLAPDRAPLLASTVLKVGHHGSKTSTGTPFVAAVRPKFAVVSCGCYNGYGHPRPEPLETLQKAGARVYRTDSDSHVCASSDGKTVTLATAAAKEVDLPQAGFDAPEISPATISENVGKWVRLKGKVTAMRKAADGATYILTVDGKASVVIFKGVSKFIIAEGVALDAVEGKDVTVGGIVQDHKKYGLQIVINSKNMFHVTP